MGMLHRQGLHCLGLTGDAASAPAHGTNDEQNKAQSAQPDACQRDGEAVDKHRGDKASNADDGHNNHNH